MGELERPTTSGCNAPLTTTGAVAPITLMSGSILDRDWDGPRTQTNAEIRAIRRNDLAPEPRGNFGWVF